MRKERQLHPTRILALVAALVLCACSSEPVSLAKWSKPGADQQTFVSVRAGCVHSVEAQSAAFYAADVRSRGRGGVFGELADDLGADFGWKVTGDGLDRDSFQRCMNAHGWSLDQKGFAPPDSDEMVMGH
jgi:hypothetical protein